MFTFGTRASRVRGIFAIKELPLEKAVPGGNELTHLDKASLRATLTPLMERHYAAQLMHVLHPARIRN